MEPLSTCDAVHSSHSYKHDALDLKAQLSNIRPIAKQPQNMIPQLIEDSLHHKTELDRLERTLERLDISFVKSKTTLERARTHRDSLSDLLAAISADYNAHRELEELMSTMNHDATSKTRLTTTPFEFDLNAYIADLVSLDEAIQFVSARVNQEQQQLQSIRSAIIHHESELRRCRDALAQLEEIHKPAAKAPASLFKVPDEVWSDIWELLMGEELEIWRSGSKFYWYNQTAPEVAGRVAAVCREWRRIALATPKLWSFVLLRSGQYVVNETQRDYFTTYKERSFLRPLEITLIQYDSHTTIAEEYLGILKERKFARLDLCFSTTLPSTQQRARLLDQLDIDNLSISYRNQFEEYPLPSTANVTTLNCADFRPHLTSPNTYLKSLTLDYCSTLPYSLSELLENLPELESFTILSLNADRTLLTGLPESRYQHDSLRYLAFPADKLDILVPVLESYVFTPNLGHLNLLGLKGWNEAWWQNLCGNDGLESRIRKLTVNVKGADADFDFNKLFSPLKSVTSLVLEGSGAALALKVMEPLDGEQKERLCPKLEELTIEDALTDGTGILEFVTRRNRSRATSEEHKVSFMRKINFVECPTIATTVRDMIANECVVV